MKTTIVGLGLIGGSIALDLRHHGIANSLIGVDCSEENATQALELGIVDAVNNIEEAVQQAELVILAIPVNALLQQLSHILDMVSDNAIVIDLGSTKGRICQSVANHPKRHQYVAAHPIAGTENSGPGAAFKGLFVGKTNIICEHELSSQRALEKALHVFDTIGMNTIYMHPEEHDKHVAYVSHLSHVSSFLLGQTVLDIEKDEKNIFNLAGSGFASTVRLAKSSPAMWAPIFEQNAHYLSQALLEYIMHLQRFQYALMKKDTDELIRVMTQANQIRHVLDKKQQESSLTPQIK